MQPEPPSDQDLSSLLAPPQLPSGGSGSLFSEEVEAYSQAQNEDDPDLARKTEFTLKTRAMREAAEDRALDRKMRQEQHDRQMTMIDDVLKARKGYANKIYCLVVVWLIVIGLFLLLQGMNGFTTFNLDNKVILTLIGGTTLNVLGIFTIVANFLFPKNGGHLMSVLRSSPTDDNDAAAGKPKATKPTAKRTTRKKKPEVD